MTCASRNVLNQLGGVTLASQDFKNASIPRTR